MSRTLLLASCHVAATALVSLSSLYLVGAPRSALIVQAGAFFVAAAVATRARWISAIDGIHPCWLVAAVLLAAGAVLFAGEGGGPRRWLWVGPVALHPGSLAGSLVLVGLAHARARADRACAILAGLAILLFGVGNDGATSLAFALGVTGLLMSQRDARHRHLPLAVLAWACVAWSALRPDTLAPVGYVELVLSRTFAAAPLLGVAGAIALAMLPLPFLVAARAPTLRGPGLALAGFWLGLALAGAFGNYPIPVIGYGASPVIGWILALSFTLHTRTAASSAGQPGRLRRPGRQ